MGNWMDRGSKPRVCSREARVSVCIEDTLLGFQGIEWSLTFSIMRFCSVEKQCIEIFIIIVLFWWIWWKTIFWKYDIVLVYLKLWKRCFVIYTILIVLSVWCVWVKTICEQIQFESFFKNDIAIWHFRCKGKNTLNSFGGEVSHGVGIFRKWVLELALLLALGKNKTQSIKAPVCRHVFIEYLIF
jgi:hypothetical protein